ncbi:MAG: PepSY domain-containing protein [Sporomusaceae bacterium]|nr:PepSY domain-containing protein [Sporomusaceae bacterium]
MNKRFLAALCAAGVLTVSATALAAITEQTATEIAAKWVPASAEHMLTKPDGNEYEVEFLHKGTNEKYKIEVNKQTAAVTEVKTKRLDNRGSQLVSLDETVVRDIVRSEYPDAVIRSVKLDRDDGLQKFEVKFTAGNLRGEMEINPETGVIIERELHY